MIDREFRKDLFYRINVINIHLPPLRRMGADVMRIAHRLLDEFDQELQRGIEGFAPEAEQALLDHTWPGNVRELRNVLERAVIFARGTVIQTEDLVLTDDGLMSDVGLSEDGFSFPSRGSLEELEQAYIRHVMEEANTSYSEVARILGISKKTLWEKRKRYNLDDQVRS